MLVVLSRAARTRVPTLRALNTVNIAKGFEVGIAIVLVAIVLDRFFRRDEKGHGQ